MPPTFILQVMKAGGVRAWEQGYKCKFILSFREPDMIVHLASYMPLYLEGGKSMLMIQFTGIQVLG